MECLRVVISPLSWGLGHAGRMIPLAQEFRRKGCEVIFAADEQLLQLVSRELTGERVPGSEQTNKEIAGNFPANGYPAGKLNAAEGFPGTNSPAIRLVPFPGLRIRYSRLMPQYICIFLQLPQIIAASLREYRLLKRMVTEFKPDLIISDNRFGFRHREVFSVYVTHQLRIPFPAALRFLEPVGTLLHRMVINRFDLCLVPDHRGSSNLSGRLSHGLRHQPRNMVCQGPLSRFAPVSLNALAETLPAAIGKRLHDDENTCAEGNNVLSHHETSQHYTPPLNVAPHYTTQHETPQRDIPQQDTTLPSPSPDPYICLVLSGPEPQRSLLFEKVCAALRDIPDDGRSAGEAPAAGRKADCNERPARLVVLSSTMPRGVRAHDQHRRPVSSTPPDTLLQTGFIISPGTAVMRQMICGASLVIARAGYTMIMELVSLGKGALLIPTPGQPEQEYLGRWLNGRHGFITLSQKQLDGKTLYRISKKSESPIIAAPAKNPDHTSAGE